jgi:cysteine desulfuration protein SufE
MSAFTYSEIQGKDVEEFLACASAEERLSWLMERSYFHPEIPRERCTVEGRVPGCLSGLWLEASCIDSRCLFAARSESEMVQGIVSFICDLYSGRSPSEIIALGDTLAHFLGLERLLSLTRKRAVLSTISFILSYAKRHDSTQLVA